MVAQSSSDPASLIPWEEDITILNNVTRTYFFHAYSYSRFLPSAFASYLDINACIVFTRLRYWRIRRAASTPCQWNAWIFTTGELLEYTAGSGQREPPQTCAWSGGDFNLTGSHAWKAQGSLIGVLNKQPSVIMFTYTIKLGPHVHTACVKPTPPCHCQLFV